MHVTWAVMVYQAHPESTIVCIARVRYVEAGCP